MSGMTDKVEGITFLVVMLVLSFIFQIQMKLFAGEVVAGFAQVGPAWADRLRAAMAVLITWRVPLIGVLAVSLFGLWLLTLTRLDLSVALPVVAAAMAANAVGGALVLGEALTAMRLAGILIVALGVVLVLRG
jgi:hypothetical protein